MSDRWQGSEDHPFWSVVSGATTPAPGSALLRWTAERAELGSGVARSRFEISEDFANPIGGVQGGYLVAMLDDSMQIALVTLLDADEVAPTLELKASFLRPARPGPFTGEGRVVHRGRSVAFLDGTLSDGDGRVVATATATATIRTVAGSAPAAGGLEV